MNEITSVIAVAGYNPPIIKPFLYITSAKKFRMVLHSNPMRQRGETTGSLAGALGWSTTFFVAGVIDPRVCKSTSPFIQSNYRRTPSGFPA